MPLAIVQTALDPPSLEQLQRAFAAVPSLTRFDAHFAARDAFGVLIDNLADDDARRLHRALAAEGVDTRVVDQDQLPKLPPHKTTKRMDCLGDRLVIYDALGRARPIEWPQVVLIAAGSVTLTEQKRTETVRFHRYGNDLPVTVTEIDYKDVQQDRLVLELIVRGDPPRYRAVAHGFLYNYLGPRRRQQAAENFRLLLADLVGLAKGAALNRGAAGLVRQPPQFFHYPTRHAFEEELSWLLWRMVGLAGLDAP